MNNKNKSLLLLTGFSCNNNCLMCSISGKGENYPDRSHHDLIGDLKEGREQGFCSVEFTGGEVTIRRDVIDLVSAAKTLGYQGIAFSTNGRLFSYSRFCQQIIEAGLNKITFSLLGPDKKTHEALTRTPGSFEEIIAGIKNAQKYPKVHLNISSVISRLNFKPIKKFGSFVQSLGIRHWYLLDLIPDSNARKFYDVLAARLPGLSKELNRLEDLASGFEEFGFFDFPLCLFAPKTRDLKNVCLVNAKMRSQTSQQVGYNPRRIAQNKEGVYADDYRVNIAICEKCKYHKECGGIWKEYLVRFGEGEINNLAKKNDCLIRRSG